MRLACRSCGRLVKVPPGWGRETGWRCRQCVTAGPRSADIRSLEPHGREVVPRVRQSDVDVPAGPAERDRLDVLLAVLGPHNAGHDRYRVAEGVLGCAGTGRIEDGLPW
jgi:hypothetical protein